MNLGIFLSSGDSFKNMAKVGQEIKFLDVYIDKYSKNFDQVFIFSYAKETVLNLPKNVHLISNKYGLHRYIYGFLLPLINRNVLLKCDVIRTYHLLGALPAIISRVVFNKPFVFNYAYDYTKFARIEGKVFPYLLIRLLNPIALHLATKIIAANKHIYNRISKSIYIPNGVDITMFKPRKKIVKKRRLQVLSIGRLEKQKNFENVIKALVDLNSDYTIIGRGSLKEKLIFLGKKYKVNLKTIDVVKNNELPKYYRKTDIFLLPSVIEGSPKVLLEAMSSGVAVIGSDIEGVDDIIVNEFNGLICKTDRDSIRSVFLKLSKDRELRRAIGKNARKYIERNHEINSLLSNEINILKSLVKDHD